MANGHPSTNIKLEQLLQTAQQALQNNNDKYATRCLDEALRLDARNAQANYLAGIIAFQHGMTQKGIKSLTKALKSDACNPGIHNTLGSMLLSAKKLQEAQKHFKKAIAS